MRFFALITLLVLLTGCPKDERIKRQSSLLNVKTQVTAKEFNDAPTPEKKVEVAKEYFDTAPKMTQVLDDYMAGREPAPAPTPSK
jgi:hypothetical protein